MLGTPLSYQELSHCLQGASSSFLEDDVPRLLSSLQYHQERIDDLSRSVESLDAGPMKRTFLQPKLWTTQSRKKKKAAKLDELRRSKRDSYAAIKALHILLSPIRRLPPELLTEIFIYCLPQTMFVRPGDADSPLRLMLVCTEWWKVCVSSPQMWSSLELVRPTHSQNENTIEHPKGAGIFSSSSIDLWLSRSGDLPISLSILDDLLAVDVVQDILGTYSRRLQHLKVNIPTKTSPSLPDYDYPHLEVLEIRTPRGLTIGSVNTISRSMLRAPRLRGFIWKSVTSGVFIPPPLELCWSNITHLTLHATITVDHCFTILSSASKVTYVDFKDIFALPRTLHYPDITLPMLSNLTLCSHHDISVLIDSLTLPNLIELSIDIRTWPFDSIFSLFRRSKFPLQILSFFFVPLQELELIKCLECIQLTLTELTVQTISPYVVTDTLLDRLTCTSPGAVLCPRLQVLAFYDCISCSPGRLALMARSRLHPNIFSHTQASASSETREEGQLDVFPLRIIELYSSNIELPSLKPLRHMGLQLITYSVSDAVTTVDVDLF